MVIGIVLYPNFKIPAPNGYKTSSSSPKLIGRLWYVNTILIDDLYGHIFCWPMYQITIMHSFRRKNNPSILVKLDRKCLHVLLIFFWKPIYIGILSVSVAAVHHSPQKAVALANPLIQHLSSSVIITCTWLLILNNL